jgi:DNA-binding transcriptional regulator YbjK
MVQKSIITAKDDERRAKLIQAYTEHLKREHHATAEQIALHLGQVVPHA